MVGQGCPPLAASLAVPLVLTLLHLDARSTVATRIPSFEENTSLHPHMSSDGIVLQLEPQPQHDKHKSIKLHIIDTDHAEQQSNALPSERRSENVATSHRQGSTVAARDSLLESHISSMALSWANRLYSLLRPAPSTKKSGTEADLGAADDRELSQAAAKIQAFARGNAERRKTHTQRHLPTMSQEDDEDEGKDDSPIPMSIIVTGIGILATIGAMYWYLQRDSNKDKPRRLSAQGVDDGNFNSEWEQTQSTATIYVKLPPTATAHQLEVAVRPHHLRVSVANQSRPLLDGEVFAEIDPEGSSWVVSISGELAISLTKVNEAEWPQLEREAFDVQ